MWPQITVTSLHPTYGAFVVSNDRWRSRPDTGHSDTVDDWQVRNDRRIRNRRPLRSRNLPHQRQVKYRSIHRSTRRHFNSFLRMYFASFRFVAFRLLFWFLRSTSISVSVCLPIYVCLTARISRIPRSKLREMFCTCYLWLWSVLLWQQCNMLCTFGFVDGVIFAHNRSGVIGNSTISIECIRVPINCSLYNYVPVCLAPFLTDFNLHYLYLTPSFGVIPLEFGRDLCRLQK